MKELISQLVAKADLSEAQATKVAEVVRGFLGSKLPDALRGPVESALTGQISDLQTQHAQLQGEEEKLTLASQRLQAKVEAFRTRKETIKATYTAAQAQTRINEAFSGISEEMGDVGLAIQRAEDKTAQMQARTGAIDELLASGALDDPTGTAKDDITLELEQLASTSDVENELARMKAALGAGPGAAPQAIEGQQPPAQTEQAPTQAAQQPSLDAQSPQEYQAPPSQGQEAPPAQPQGDLR